MNKRVKMYLCDDACNFRNEIENRLEGLLPIFKYVYEIEVFYSGADLLTHYANDMADVVFLDIDMPEMSGFQVARELREINREIHIIFITSHEEMVFQSYEYHPFWFVRKSHMDDLDIVLPKLITKLHSEREKTDGVYRLVLGDAEIDFDVNAIKYVEAFRHYIILNYTDGIKKQYRCKISEAEKLLKQFYFVRVQNSVIVNSRFISKVNSREVILKNDESISISRNRIDYVKSEFLRFLRSN